MGLAFSCAGVSWPQLMGPQAFLWARGSYVDSISQRLRCPWEHLPTAPTFWLQMWSCLEAGVGIQSTGCPRAGEGIGGLPLYFLSYSLVSLRELTAHLTHSYLYAFTQAIPLSWNHFPMNSKFKSSFKAFAILTMNDLWSANLEISFILSYTWVLWDALCPINCPSLFFFFLHTKSYWVIYRVKINTPDQLFWSLRSEV